jgi:DNA polymerase III subunit gamma/tau
VKFIFCTTDPEKIPVTVVSRCQRFDFAPIESSAISDRLRFILQQERREVDEAALPLLARHAAGSMRDSQSLLEQLLAFCPGRITVQDVTSMLGAADTQLVDDLATCLLNRDAGGALDRLDQAMTQGAEAGQLAEQLLAFFRDMLVATAGGSARLALHFEEQAWAELAQRGQQVGLETLMAVAQILDQSLVRMRQSTHGRMLLELALVRVAALDRLDDLGDLLQALQSDQPLPGRAAVNPPPPSGGPTSPRLSSGRAEKKTADPAPPLTAPRQWTVSGENAAAIWQDALLRLDGVLAEMAGSAERVAITAPNRLVVVFPAGYNLHREGCERPDRKSKIEKALEEVTGTRLAVELQVDSGKTEVAEAPIRTSRQMKRDSERHELVAHAKEMFDAEVVRVDVPRNADS